MSEYLPSFIVEPVLRQARRFSRLSGADESPSFLPAVAVPDLQRWSPYRLWNTSPPPSLEETDEVSQETVVQSFRRSIQQWASQLNAFDSVPSPPLDAMDDVNDLTAPAPTPRYATTIEFPPLEPEVARPRRPPAAEDQRASSDTSVNPARELPYRSRAHQDTTRPHSLSDPLATVRPTATGLSDLLDSRHEDRAHGYPRAGASSALPEDDGMGPLRQRISAVWSGPGTPAEKSRLVHALMMERYRTLQAVRAAQRSITLSPGAPGSTTGPAFSSSAISTLPQDVVFSLSPEDLRPTYAPMDADADETDEPASPDLGCVHYKRNVKLQCDACGRWYPCRLCHDEVEAHVLPRRDTKHMLCMLCNTPQPVGQFCKMCHVQAACYYCPICKLWNNDPAKSIYHCDDCGICRLGEGLGKDFFHCKTCAACMSIQAESTHRCIERSTKSDCPICGEYMFTSSRPVAFMRCGHSIHESCFAEWCRTSYKCPICSKSITNMESQFRRLDRHIEEQPMPQEYRDNRAYIFCNDCNSRSIARYHWLGLKCAICESYNTTQLELLGAPVTPQLQEQQERAQQGGDGEAVITASQSRTPPDQMTQPVDVVRPAHHAFPQPIDTLSATALPSVQSRSSWLLPSSPTRSARSTSPVVGSYFGTGQQSSSTPEPPRRGASPLEDDDELDFWGRPNSPSQEAERGATDSDSESGSSNESVMDDDDDEEEDAMDLFGHR